MTDETRPDTLLTHAGRDPAGQHGFVNPPLYRGSTVLFPSVAAMEACYHKPLDRQPEDVFRYGRIGSPTSEAFEDAVTALEGGYRSVALCSGLAAVTVALTALLKAGDHLLMVDTVYDPTRRFCDRTLGRFGVETTYYDPAIGAGIAELVRPNTRAVYLEAPGSQTFEMQDVPAIAAVARERGLVSLIDNTWATPLYFRPLALGIDLVIHAATKYLVGHADANLGVVVAGSRQHYLTVKQCAVQLGICAGPDELYLGLRGMRSLGARLRQHQASALEVARWLQARPEVDRVLYPALPEDPGHALWQRDFTGATGLFGIVLKPVPKAAVDAMLDGMALIPMGASWGGYESLLVPTHPASHRTAVPWTEPGPTLRLHVGLEDPRDLIADLEQGFVRLNAAAAS